MMKAKARQSSQKADCLQVRIDDTEKLAFEDAAKMAGMTLSAWARLRLRHASRQELEQERRSVAFLKR